MSTVVVTSRCEMNAEGLGVGLSRKTLLGPEALDQRSGCLVLTALDNSGSTKASRRYSLFKFVFSLYSFGGVKFSLKCVEDGRRHGSLREIGVPTRHKPRLKV